MASHLNLLPTVVAVLSIAIAVYYVYTKKLFGYWKKRNVSTLTPSFPFGDLSQVFLSRKSIAEVATDIYNATDKPLIGLYSLVKPILMVRDPELIKGVCVNDFSSFTDRGIFSDEERDPISAHLFSMQGEKWRTLRSKLSPSFSTGKLKVMFPTFVACSDRLEGYLDDQVAKGIPIDARELLARYATDIIASVAFGIDVDCINNPDNDFRKMGRQIFASSWTNALRNTLLFYSPWLAQLFRVRAVDANVEKFLYNIVESNMEYREKNKVTRKDFFQILLQLRNTGTVGVAENLDGKFTESKIKNLTLDDMVAQTFVFYIGGFETTSTTMSFCMFEMAKNQEIQRKVHEEVQATISRHDGKINYESLAEMKYLDMVIDETLRMYPPFPILTRQSNRRYKFPGTDVTIEPNTSIFIPSYGLHHDAKYFPDPEKFSPERFENPKAMDDLPYHPFGYGPRICIGQRMGKMQTKVGLAVMMKNTRFELDANAPQTLKFDPKNLVLGPVERPKLRATKIVT